MSTFSSPYGADFYPRMRKDVAERLIRQLGKTAELIKPGEPTGPPYDPQPGPPTEHDIILVETGYDIMNRDATLVQDGDKFGIISTEDAPDPLLRDTIRIDGIIYQLVQVMPFNPGSLIMLWKIQARK